MLTVFFVITTFGSQFMVSHPLGQDHPDEGIDSGCSSCLQGGVMVVERFGTVHSAAPQWLKWR